MHFINAQGQTTNNPAAGWTVGRSETGVMTYCDKEGRRVRYMRDLGDEAGLPAIVQTDFGANVVAMAIARSFNLEVEADHSTEPLRFVFVAKTT
jgi:hypothetical protein